MLRGLVGSSVKPRLYDGVTGDTLRCFLLPRAEWHSLDIQCSERTDFLSLDFYNITSVQSSYTSNMILLQDIPGHYGFVQVDRKSPGSGVLRLTYR
jgi:hypothetical protein